MRLVAARWPAAAAVAAVLAVVLSGCGQPAYRYVSSNDRDLVIRIPRAWSQLNSDDVLKAGGTDPATADIGWVAFYDAASRPTPAHLAAGALSEPVLAAQSQDLSKESAAALTTDDMRNIFAPVTDAARAQDDSARTQAGLPPRKFTLIDETVIKTKTAQGIRLMFSYTTQIPVLTPAPSATSSSTPGADAPAAGPSTSPSASSVTLAGPAPSTQTSAEPAASGTAAASPAPSASTTLIPVETDYFDQVVVTDLKRTRLHTLLVHCSKDCFSANEALITDAVDSLTVKLPNG